jgi:hypothetical protein
MTMGGKKSNDEGKKEQNKDGRKKSSYGQSGLEIYSVGRLYPMRPVLLIVLYNRASLCVKGMSVRSPLFGLTTLPVVFTQAPCVPGILQLEKIKKAVGFFKRRFFLKRVTHPCKMPLCWT